MLSIFIAPAVYDPGDGVLREVERLVAWVKASPPAVPGQGVLAPGDVERMTRSTREREGIPLDDTTWQDLLAAAQGVGIDAGRARALARQGPPQAG